MQLARVGFDRITMNKSSHAPERSAFTLIELLVVIAIIGILMSLLFPAVNGALLAARKAQASNDVSQIATAIIAYNTEYGQWPTNASGSASDVGGPFLQALMGTNTRGLTFLEVNNFKGKKSGLSSNGLFLDSWSNAYQYAVDMNYGSAVSNTPSWAGSAPRRSVAVWQQTNKDYKGTSGRLPAISW
jgi:prepilin-type N-terminal cleavage/methylation domain-containing protein